MMLSTIATVLCVVVFGTHAFDFRPELFNGTCPNIVTDSVEGVEGRWYAVYSTFSGMLNVLCSYGDVVSLGNDKFKINSVVDLNNGQSIPFASTIEKEADGKYYYTWERSAGETERGLTMMKRDGDFLLSWSCVAYENGTHTDIASIFSKTKETSDAVVSSFTTYLTEHGSKAGQFIEVPHENCSA